MGNLVFATLLLAQNFISVPEHSIDFACGRRQDALSCTRSEEIAFKYVNDTWRLLSPEEQQQAEKAVLDKRSSYDRFYRDLARHIEMTLRDR